MSMITCKDLCLGYDRQVVADHISFTIERGDYLCILGENGAGKSTLMKTLLHLTPPLAGSMTYSDDLAENEIGYLPQHTAVQKDFPASVREIVLSGNLARLHRLPFYRAEDRKRAELNMERMGITNLRHASYRKLSGGQQQRVLLARALCATEKALLLDEPVTGLDPKATAELYQVIADLNHDGVTIIMISHDLQTAAAEAKHILHIGKHRQLFFGTREAYLESAAYRSLQAEESEPEEELRAEPESHMKEADRSEAEEVSGEEVRG